MAAVEMRAAEAEPARPQSGLQAVPAPGQLAELPDGFWYSVKRRVLGPPLVTEQLTSERLSHAAAQLAAADAAAPGTHVTLILPRRSYPPLAGRMLHDHTADRIARRVSRVPGAAAMIIPFDVQHKVDTLRARRAGRPAALRDYERPVPPDGTDPISSLGTLSYAIVQGRLRAAEVRPTGSSSLLACELADSTGNLTALFYGRTHIAGLEPGRQIRLHGMVSIGHDGHPAVVNPRYELVS